MSKKNILIACNSEFVFNKMLKKLILKLELKYKVYVVLNLNDKDDKKFSKNINLIHFDYPNSFSIYKILISLKNMYKIAKNIRPEIIISCNRNSSFIARLICFLYKPKFNIYIAYGFYFHDYQNKLIFFLSYILEKFLSLNTNLTLSQSNKDTMVALKFKSNKNIIKTIYNGIDTNLFNKNSFADHIKINKSKKLFYLITSGRLVKNKGFQDLIYALNEIINKKIFNIRLIIIGGNIKQDILNYENTLKEIVTNLNLSDYVKFTGYTDNVARELSIGDLYVLPSYREGFPTSIIEAMSSSLPIIATNIRGCNECVEENVNGFLYKKKDIKSLTNKILQIYNNSELQEKFSKNSRSLALKHYKIDKYIDTQLNSIESLIDEKL